jgi:hypothetical protein
MQKDSQLRSHQSRNHMIIRPSGTLISKGSLPFQLLSWHRQFSAVSERCTQRIWLIMPCQDASIYVLRLGIDRCTFRSSIHGSVVCLTVFPSRYAISCIPGVISEQINIYDNLIINIKKSVTTYLMALRHGSSKSGENERISRFSDE